MPGLDPGIHDECFEEKLSVKLPMPLGFMDCEVKAGNACLTVGEG